MRILTAPRSLSLDQIGLAPSLLSQLKEMAEKPYGLLFVCGPTGSGKTTTLHSLLGYINTADRKIWTVEDPIEITQDGLCQVQVNAKIGLTFPEILRSFLRADPDVIMVGETRDHDTARTVVAASLTGHLVLSTMHTNSAVESVVRLLDIGLDPFNFSDALIGAVGQRLVRRLCAVCRKPHAASQEELDALAKAYCFGTDLDPAMVVRRWRSEHVRTRLAHFVLAAGVPGLRPHRIPRTHRTATRTLGEPGGQSENPVQGRHARHHAHSDARRHAHAETGWHRENSARPYGPQAGPISVSVESPRAFHARYPGGGAAIV